MGTVTAFKLDKFTPFLGTCLLISGDASDGDQIIRLLAIPFFIRLLAIPFFIKILL
ncbi:hypothetical protein [Spiroplasma poulsonii]|uniref:hypothetical protein n=1 Tax=Spiroplasma poulsonii TaxID=2138 RepID=UPI00131A43F8|nr:hypothetical protein [Spiroplasma poulsonii]